MERKMKYNMIGLCGLARCGKDTLCKALIHECSLRGITAKRYSIADYLKNELKSFILEQFGIDVWNCTDEEKELIRPIMVEWGLIKRKQSNGQYLTGILQKTIDFDRIKSSSFQVPSEMLGTALVYPAGVDLPIVTDIRYHQYENDEVSWVKNKNNGALVHIKRIVAYDDLGEPIFTCPPNEQEALNDPLLQSESDYHVEWEGIEAKYPNSDHDSIIAKFNEYNKVAREVLDKLEIVVGV